MSMCNEICILLLRLFVWGFGARCLGSKCVFVFRGRVGDLNVGHWRLVTRLEVNLEVSGFRLESRI